eukprot:11158049-Alexandrium_andersonii.AAC.1
MEQCFGLVPPARPGGRMPARRMAGETVQHLEQCARGGPPELRGTVSQPGPGHHCVALVHGVCPVGWGQCPVLGRN